VLYDVDMTLGKNIKKARERLNMTQSQLGAHFGISPQAVSQWEKGEDRPDIEKLPKLAQILEVSVDWLLTGHEAALDPEGPWSLWKLLSAAQRPLASGLLKTLVDQTAENSN
jgi:transcriptional regulator with XRE-family HTH domain